MFDKVRFLRETLSALQAGVGAFPGVKPVMDHKAGTPRERLPAHGAREWLLAPVASLVANKRRFLVKAFPALRADVRLDSCVDSLVLQKARLPREALPAI